MDNWREVAEILREAGIIDQAGYERLRAVVQRRELEQSQRRQERMDQLAAAPLRSRLRRALLLWSDE